MMLPLRTPRTAPQASVIHLLAGPPPLDALASGEPAVRWGRGRTRLRRWLIRIMAEGKYGY